MPKRTKVGKKRKAKRVSKGTEAKLDQVGDELAPEDLEVYLKDFDVQVGKEISKLSRLFQKEAKKIAMAELPTKSSLPRDVAKMSLVEFRSRGNSVPSVVESLKKDKEKAALGDVGSSLEMVVTQENRDPNLESFVTPAMNKRTTRATTRATTARATTRVTTRTRAATATTAAATVAETPMRRAGRTGRVPQPDEELKVSVHSAVTGSPVDGAVALEVYSKDLVTEFKDLVADILIADLPQCHRRKVMRAIKLAKAQQESRLVGRDVIKTPAVIR